MSKNILFILMPKDYRDEEFYEPYNILKQKGYQIDVAGLEPGTSKGANGHEFNPNLNINEMQNEDFKKYDALVIPGGPGSPKYLWNNQKVLDIIKLFHDNNKVVAAICYAVIPVVKSGILRDKKATVYPTDEAKEILQKNNVTFLHDGTVTLEKEKIITSQGPAFAKDFGEQVSILLQE
ncbi:hypothetical protein GF385_01180 [Candidatus Dependentiae bacterium]|nr:hypothetical protein [Candidatus Dependentiae bacterium]